MFRSIIITLFISLGLLLTACEPREDQPPADPPQQQQQQEMPAETGQPGIELTEDELDEFIDANQELTDQQIDPRTDRQALEEVLEDKEMDVNRFHEIQTAVEQDPALQQQIQQRIQQRQQQDTPDMQ